MLPLLCPKQVEALPQLSCPFYSIFKPVFMGSSKSAASKTPELTLPSSQIPYPRLCLSHHNLACLIYVMHSLIHSFNKYVLVTNDMRGSVKGAGDTSESLTDMVMVPMEFMF